jgi:hypothetical protein
MPSWHFSARKAKTRFPLCSIFQRLGPLKNGRASYPAENAEYFSGSLSLGLYSLQLCVRYRQ